MVEPAVPVIGPPPPAPTFPANEDAELVAAAATAPVPTVATPLQPVLTPLATALTASPPPAAAAVGASSQPVAQDIASVAPTATVPSTGLPEFVGGLRDIGASDTPIGDVPQSGGPGVLNLLDAAGSVNRIVEAVLNEDQSVPARVASGLSGATRLLADPALTAGTALAPVTAALRTNIPGTPIPYVQAALAGYQAVQAGLDAESTDQAFLNAMASLTDSAVTFLTGAVGMTIGGGHAIGDTIRMLYRPDVPHAVREAREVARDLGTAGRSLDWAGHQTTAEAYVAQLLTTPNLIVGVQTPEGDRPVRSVDDFLLNPEGLYATIQSGVAESTKAPFNDWATRQLKGNAYLFLAANAGEPAAVEALQLRHADLARVQDEVRALGEFFNVHLTEQIPQGDSMADVPVGQIPGRAYDYGRTLGELLAIGGTAGVESSIPAYGQALYGQNLGVPLGLYPEYSRVMAEGQYEHDPGRLDYVLATTPPASREQILEALVNRPWVVDPAEIERQRELAVQQQLMDGE